MDLWVVAAAAGAGYMAKNLPNFSVEKKESLGGSSSLKYLHPESRNLVQQLRDKTCPLRRLAQDDSFLDLDSVVSVNEKTGRGRRCGGQSIRPLTSSRSCGDMENMHHSMSDETNHKSTSLKQLKLLDKFRKPAKSSSRSSSSKGADAMLFFISGMTVGILTASTSWKSEVDKLNMQLNQMQNLVEDLHEELDMNETLMVKELGGGEEDTPNSSLSKSNECDGVKANDNLELLSRIEAELEAELEMLEQNIKTSEMERRICGVVELDPDFEPEIVRGDLKATMVKDDTSESGSRMTDTMSDCSKPANYVVSPWELSLRLHELIESRLATRIKELETALSHSEVRHSIVSGRRFSHSGTESSSIQHSPACICDEHDIRENEPSSGSPFSNNGESGSTVVDQGTHSTNKTQNGDYDSISHHGGITGGDRSPNLAQDMQRLMSLMSNEDSMSEDEGSDESELLLIKQIIERRKSSSSFKSVLEYCSV